MVLRNVCWRAGLVLAVALSVAAARADEKEVRIAKPYKVGDVERMKLVINFSVGGMEGTIEETARSTVKEVKKNGDVVLVGTVEKGHISVAGQEQDIPETPPTTETRTKLDKLVDLKADVGPGSPFTPEVTKLMAACSDVLYPEKPVKVGDSWTTEFDNPVVKDKKAAIKTTFVAIDKVADQDCWKIKQTGEFEVGAGQPKMTTEMVYWLNPADGRVVKAEGNSKDVPAQMGSMSWTVKMTRLKPEAVKATPIVPAGEKP